MAIDPRDELLPFSRDSESRREHVPVLLGEVLELLAVKPGGSYIDATFGGGGHTQAILDRSAPDGRVLALDADPEAIARACDLTATYQNRLSVAHGNFRDLRTLAEEKHVERVDGVLMDLGLSSFQLNHAERGFSFRRPGPLDMRFDTASGISAEDIVNNWSEEDIAAVIFEYGEETAVARDRPRRRSGTTEGANPHDRPAGGYRRISRRRTAWQSDSSGYQDIPGLAHRREWRARRTTVRPERCD